MTRLSLVTFLLLAVASASADTKHVTLVNQCHSKVYVALASYVHSLGRFYWATEGWIPLEPGETQSRRVSAGRNPSVRVHTQDGRVLSGNDGTFCVSDGPFSGREYAQNGHTDYFVLGHDDIQGAGNSCQEAGGRLMDGFQRLDFENQYTNINFNLQCN